MRKAKSNARISDLGQSTKYRTLASTYSLQLTASNSRRSSSSLPLNDYICPGGRSYCLWYRYVLTRRSRSVLVSGVIGTSYSIAFSFLDLRPSTKHILVIRRVLRTIRHHCRIRYGIWYGLAGCLQWYGKPRSLSLIHQPRTPKPSRKSKVESRNPESTVNAKRRSKGFPFPSSVVTATLRTGRRIAVCA